MKIQEHPKYKNYGADRWGNVYSRYILGSRGKTGGWRKMAEVADSRGYFSLKLYHKNKIINIRRQPAGS